MLLSASKSIEYKAQVLNASSVLLKFYKDNELLLKEVEPFNENGEIKEDFILKVSNVTKDGLDLYKDGVQKWYKYLNKNGNHENITHLQKSLSNIRR